MNIRDLKYFIAVCDLKHFGKAAEKCCVSQPTLSGQIKKLETSLNVTLFERANRRVLLTECGQHIAEAARRILRDVDEIHEISIAFNNPFSGKFRLGAFPTLSTYIFPKIVPKIKSLMPDLHLILMEEKTATLIEKLRSGVIDAALLALPVQEDFLKTHVLFDDAFRLAVPTGHALAQQTEIEQAMLADYNLLLLEEGHCLRNQALEICELHGIREELDLKATGLETLREMVRAGTGITFIPEIAIRKNDPGVQYISFKHPAPMRTIGIVWRKTSVKEQVIKKIIPFMTSET
jgi:LysR family hydrogen peroxide-inducible transcriptional activator